MTFNIFGPASKDAIQVGYISTDRGFVDGVSVCEANEYAKLNPGTQFVFRTRNFIKYLNINEVNKLTPDDLTPSERRCSGINFESECGQPQVYFYGGGGVGVQGNPVIGEDGSLLAIDLVEGGYGYQYAPIVEVKDKCNIGVGAVTRAVLGDIVETVEYYDQEGDFEEYEICNPDTVGYGRRYGPNGEDLGPWEPTLYANLSKDPIEREIKEYQDFLRELQTPWWTTRKEPPLRLTSGNKITRTKFDVNDKPFVDLQIKAGSKSPVRWSDFMNSYAISPVPPSNVPGSDFAGIVYSFEWEEDFPYDGEYIFRGACDNKAELYIDNQKVLDLSSGVVLGNGVSDPLRPLKKTIKSGVHRIRLDLLNVPVKEVVQAPAAVSASGVICHAGGGKGGLVNQENQTAGGQVIVGKGGNGGASLILSNAYGLFPRSIGGGAGLRNGRSADPSTGTTNTVNNPSRSSVGSNLDGSPAGSRLVLRPSSLNLSELPVGYGFGGNGFSGSRKGGTIKGGALGLASFIDASDGGSGAVRIKFGGKVQDFTTPGTYEFTVPAGITAVDVVCIGGGGSGHGGTIVPKSPADVYGGGGSGGAYAYADGVSVTPGTKLKIVVGSGGKAPKAISWLPSGDFPLGGGPSDGSSLTSQNGEDTYVQIQSPGSPSTPSTPKSTKSTNTQSNKPQRVFNTVDYINKANRTLWRTNVYGRGGFLNENGVCPFDTNTQLETNPYAGVHQIVWDNIDFPVDGNYIIEVEVDDNVTLTFSGQSGNTVITKKGFTGGDRSTGKTTETRFFKAGKYKIIADLEQIPGGAFGFSSVKGINPMALAVNVTTAFTGEEVVSAKSWNQNPMGVSLTIDAPMPPIPQEPIPRQEGRCPNNPIWTTRFPNGKEKWYPVKDPRWSKFMNRYAISPVPPFGRANTDAGGIVYRNSWNVDIPYDGFYALKGTVDNFGRVLIDGKEVVGVGRRGVTQSQKLDSFKTENPTSNKFFLTKGNHTLEIEVENQKTETFKVIDKKIFSTTDWVSQGTKNGVTYSGPALGSYRSGDLGPFLTPTFTTDEDYRANNMGRSWTLRWTGVDFPEDGRYDLRVEADDEVIVRVDGTEVGRAKVFEGVRSYTFNATKGKRVIEMELSNIPGNNTSTFLTNPVVFNAIITRKVTVGTGISKPWTENPIGISAMLIPPPCPKLIRGKGIVTDVIVDDPGNGFPRPGTGGYPVALRLKDVIVEDPGINYSCGTDQIQITPSNGAVLDYECDTFGRIVRVKVLNPGLGFTRYPEISIPSDTGINASFRPQFEIVRDPIVIDQQKLIQVTDLVGLKQTGYVDGRAYFGAVFYKDGVRYAGFYETIGELVQVYDTLQESIDAQVTTRPSAIQRQGTDITSNDPRLNLPGTPENLI